MERAGASGGERTSALARVAPLAASLARAVRRYALVALGAVVFLAALLLAPPLPSSTGGVLLLVLLLALLAAPPVVLLLLALTLREVSELPARLRELPGVGRERVEELRRLADEARRGRRRRLPLVVWRLVRLLASTRELLQPHAPLLALASPPFLVLSGLAAVAAALEVVAAVVAALVLVLT